MSDHFDLIVIGAGSGGLAAAKRAASYSARVAIVEGDRVGGTCVIRGCVPKKLMVYGSAVSHQLSDAASYGWSLGEVSHGSSVRGVASRQTVDLGNRTNHRDSGKCQFFGSLAAACRCG